MIFSSPAFTTRSAANRAATIVSSAFGVPLADISARSRKSAPCALARQRAMYLAHVAWGLSFTAVGRCFARHYSTVRHACARTEDRREAPHVDRMLAHLEVASRLHVATFGHPGPEA